MYSKEDVEQVLGKKVVAEKVFLTSGEDFAAYNDAVAFLEKNGYSHGSMQRGAPIGVCLGEAEISKWRNLGPDVKSLDGVLIADSFRNGKVTLYLTVQDEAVSK
jgi:hypothetical protein